MIRPLATVLVCLLLASAGWAMGSRETETPPSNAEFTSLQLIAAAVEAGEIDEDTAVELRVYSVKAGDRLPERYRGGRPSRDATGVLRQARARYPELRPEVQERLHPYLFPRGQ